MMTGLSFRLFRVPFRVQVWFFVTLVLLSLDQLRSFTAAPVFKTIMFFVSMAALAVLLIVHELGHCAAYRRYGQQPSVMLWGLGGLTFGEARLPPKRKIVVAVAGVAATVVAVIIPAYLLRTYVFTEPSIFNRFDLTAIPNATLGILYWYGIFWAIVNLLPILPLDGGHVAEGVLEWRHGEPRKQTARLISWVTGVVAGLFALLALNSPGLMLMAWLLAFFNFLPWYQEQNNLPSTYRFLPDEDEGGYFETTSRPTNVRSLDKARKKRDRRSPAELIKSGYESLERRDYKAALRTAERLQGKRLNPELDRWTAELAAFAWLGERNPVKAEEVVGALPRGAAVSTPLRAVLAVANKRIDEGTRLMVQCMVNEPEGGPKLIAVDLMAEFGMTHRLARDLVDQPGGSGFEAAVALEGMLHRLHRTQDASTVSDVILLG